MRGILAAVALALATVLALLAHAVLSVAGGSSTARNRGLLAPVASHLVSTRDSGQAQRAVKGLLETRGRPGLLLRRHAESKAILTKLASSGPTPDRSWASNVLGTVAFQDSMLDRAAATSYIREALAAFRKAIVLDGTNEDPKFNLELVLTLEQMRRSSQHLSPKRQMRNTKKSTARHRESGYGY